MVCADWKVTRASHAIRSLMIRAAGGLAQSGRQMRMVWQDMSPFPTPRMDAEEERELRLAAQARAGAEWALAALIARYQPPVVRYLARLTGDAAQSHTMAQHIFVRMER